MKEFRFVCKKKDGEVTIKGRMKKAVYEKEAWKLLEHKLEFLTTDEKMSFLMDVKDTFIGKEGRYIEEKMRVDANLFYKNPGRCIGTVKRNLEKRIKVDVRSVADTLLKTRFGGNLSATLVDDEFPIDLESILDSRFEKKVLKDFSATHLGGRMKVRAGELKRYSLSNENSCIQKVFRYAILKHGGSKIA